MSVIEAVDEARAEAGLAPPAPRNTGQGAGAADADIVARARQLMAEFGGTLSASAAVDKARAETATFASKSRGAREHEAWQRRKKHWDRIEEVTEDTALALERRLMAHARELVAAARRTIADNPIEARELAIRAREALGAADLLHGEKPDHGPARRILEAASKGAA